MSKFNINTVTASAGAGKTTRIVRRISAEVKERPPEEIMATTFTVKAADELIERARAELYETHQEDKAVRLLGARFGTVNSVCGQIVAEHAFELGRSPRAEVISDDSVNRILATAASEAISKHAPVLNHIAELFGYSDPYPPHLTRPDWRTTLRRIIDLARSNGLDAGGLQSSAEKSVAGFLDLLPQPQPGVTSEKLTADLTAAVNEALKHSATITSGDGTKTVKELIKIRGKLKRKAALSWPEWARASKLKYAKTKDAEGFRKAVDDIKGIASDNFGHPQLREDCETFIRTLFACAADSLAAYDEYKATRGLIDFTDQEMLALRVLSDTDMRKRLAERVNRVFVDEFQDSSPLQIAIFTSLAEIVEASTWVGDPKQAIYGFRNADSALTQAAFLGAGQGTKPDDPLRTSYRSRKGIVDFVNEAFSPSLAAMGLKPEEHRFTGTDRKEDGFKRPPLHVWWVSGSNNDKQAAALAHAVKSVIDAPENWPVDTRKGAVRPLRIGDIAILCHTNMEVERAAASLSAIGIPVAVERDELSKTPHVELAMAALRWVADQSDRLALAEMARFFSDDPESDAWLQAVGAEDPDAALKAENPISDALEALRQQILELTPAEMVDAIITLPPLLSRIERWGNHGARLDDLEALRGFARTYETECAGSGAPATLSGLILTFEEAEAKRPKSLRPDAVNVMTYHKAKGLEWPLVILSSLHKDPEPRLFEPVAEVDGTLDWMNPLAGRWIRYWPWPYGTQKDNVGLDEAATNSEAGKLALLRARQEATRLLYVGVTRARDYAVFAPSTKNGADWLKVLDTGTGSADYIVLPKAPESISAGPHKFEAEVATLAVPEDEETAAPVVVQTHVRLGRDVVVRKPLFRTPSSEVATAPYKIVSRTEIGHRIPIVGDADMAIVGEAVHAILAADNVAAPADVRLKMAQSILDRWSMKLVKAADILKASDALHDHLLKTIPGATVVKEASVTAHIADQLVAGRMDMLIVHPGGYAIVDHKSFPGAGETIDTKALSFGPQLGLYRDAVETATGKKVTNLLVHMPISGQMIEISM